MVYVRLVDRDRLADGRRIGAESLFPPCVTHDRNRMRAGSLIVCLIQDATKTSVHSKHREIASRYELHFQLLVLAAAVNEPVRGPRDAQQTCDS